jgi:Zn-dependent M16 (insulinase) family peptidase
MLWAQTVNELKVEAHLFKHKKTGTQLLYLTCDDDNKVFSISFRTPPIDNTGIAHVMEHSALCGSEKFPSKEPFVDLLKGSLQTFLNAFTADDRTMYPVASRNDKDFKNLMDVYLDAVFFPKAKTIPEIMMQEGWHYEIDENNNLSYNGIVYNEMKGVYSSPQNIMQRLIQQSMYTESTYTNDSGGNPDNITELTQETFVKFHDQFYHPSNSLIYFYGNGDVVEHLNFLDREYLSKFKKRKIDAKIIPQPLFKNRKEVVAEYSVDVGESVAAKTFLSLSYLLPPNTRDLERDFAFNLLTYILVGSEAAPIKRAILDAEVGLDVSYAYDSSVMQPCFSIIVQNAEPDRKQTFIDVVRCTLKKLVADGIDRKLIEGAINRTEFSLREMQVAGYPKGLVLNMAILDTWTYGKDPLCHLRFERTLQSMRDGVENNVFENLVKNFFLNNKSQCFVMLKPKAGLEKENSEKLTQKLNQIKNNLTAEQLNTIKINQQKLIQRQETPDSPEDIAKIPTLSLSDVSKTSEQIPFEWNDEYLNIQVETNGVVYVSAFFDALQTIATSNDIAGDSNSYVSLLSDILTRVDTSKYNYGDLNSEIDLNTGGISSSLQIHSLKERDENLHDYKSSFVVRTKVMLPKLETGLGLLSEVINNSRFDDLDRLKEIVQELRVGLEESFIASGQRYAQLRSASYFSECNAYKEEIAGMNYYRFIVELERNFDKNGKRIVQRLQEVADSILRNSRGNVFVTLSAKDFAESKHILDDFRGTLSDRQPVAQYAPFQKNQLNEAVIIPSRVQYVAMAADYHEAGFKYSGKMKVLANLLRTGYIWNNIRVQGGAYGGGVLFERDGVFSLWSYRDPHLRRTVGVYEGIAEYLDGLKLSDNDLTKAIIATIGSLDKPLTPSEKANRVITMQLAGLTQNDMQKQREEILSTNIKELQNFAKMFREGIKQNNICVFGNEEKLEKNKNLFKNSIRPIG